jgi:CheY-like chemotaxis protein
MKQMADGTMILLVEDDPNNRDMMCRLLRLMGYPTESANNGEEALALLDRQSYSLVITDRVMPRMDGIQLTQKIRQHHKKEIREMPIIGVSACLMVEDQVRFWESGLDTFLEKPVRMRTLESIISRTLGVLETPY